MKLCPLGFQNFVSIETPVKQLVGEVKVKLICAFSTNIKAKAKRNVSTHSTWSFCRASIVMEEEVKTKTMFGEMWFD